MPAGSTSRAAVLFPGKIAGMASPARKTLRFTQIRLENWRNFRQVEVDLGQRVFLVGPNAVGKSNFLDAFRFLHEIAVSGFQRAVSLRGGVARLRSFSAPEGSDVAIAVRLGSEEQPDAWEYEIRFGKEGKDSLQAERIWKTGTLIKNRPDEEDEKDPRRLAQTLIEQSAANREFREVADFLWSLFYLHVVPQLMREPERSAGKVADPFGGDFLAQVANLPPRRLEARLRWVTRVLQAAVPQLQRLKIEGNGRSGPHLLATFLPSGREITESELSDGTIRLLGILWAHLVQPRGPLILEEPELSLHPEVVRALPQVFARMQGRFGQQILLSTHSPELIEDEGIGLNEVLLLLPDTDGTAVRPTGSFDEVPALLGGGLTLAEAVLPKTRPRQVEQLAGRIHR
jgi:predicted ATPase